MMSRWLGNLQDELSNMKRSPLRSLNKPAPVFLLVVVLALSAVPFSGFANAAVKSHAIGVPTQSGKAAVIRPRVVSTISVPSGPDALVRAGNDIWVASCSGNAVTEISSSSKQIVQQLTSESDPDDQFDCPDAVAFDDGYLWVANRLGSSITELNPSSGALVDVITGPQISDPVSLTPIAGGYLWIGNTNENNQIVLSKMDASDGDIVTTISDPNSAPYTVADPASVVYDGAHLWIESSYEFNAVSGTYIRTLLWANGNAPLFSYYYGGYIWLSAGNSPSVAKFSVANARLIKTITVSNPRSLAFNGRDLFVVNAENTDALLEYNSSGRLLKTIARSSKSDGLGFYRLLLVGNSIWTINYLSNIVAVSTT
jgi:hypothetical protein